MRGPPASRRAPSARPPCRRLRSRPPRLPARPPPAAPSRRRGTESTDSAEGVRQRAGGGGGQRLWREPGQLPGADAEVPHLQGGFALQPTPRTRPQPAAQRARQPPRCGAPATPSGPAQISAFGDLASLSSFGFRGEALSSLCAVADLSVVTRTADQEAAGQPGARVEYDREGRVVGGAKPAARAVGTTIALKDIFKPLAARQGGGELKTHVPAPPPSPCLHPHPLPPPPPLRCGTRTLSATCGASTGSC